MNLYTNAQKTLTKNTNKHGICAGSTHFKDVWARDALYASWGALTSNGARRTLHTLTQHIKDGQVPLRYGRKSMAKVFFHLPTTTGAVYGNDKTSDAARDPNSLYLITLEKYLQATGDKQLRDTKKISAAADWLLERTDNDGLVDEGAYASWDDALKKHAPSIYNNALAYAALKAAGRMTKKDRYTQAAARIKQSSKKLWSGNYYDAWIGMRVMDVPGNLLAIYTGLADQQETHAILESLDAEKTASNDTLPKTNYPRYPLSATYTPFYLIGMGDYHNQGPYWSWVAALEALVREDKQEALHQTLADWRQGSTIHEIYDSPKRPTRRLVYKSEQDFSWTAGLILAAKQ